MFLFCIACSGMAQAAPSKLTSQQTQIRLQNFLGESPSHIPLNDPRVEDQLAVDVLNVDGCPTVLDVREACLQAVKRFYTAYHENIDLRKRIFEQQYSMTIMIFGLVVTIVFAGLVFAAIQFYISARSVTNLEKFDQTKFGLSFKGLEVSSSVLGVIILVISLGFFYLYLIHVYPIVELGDPLPTFAQVKD